MAFLEDKREALTYFYPDLFAKCLSLWEQLMNYPYFRHLQKEAAPPVLPYRRRVWQLLILGTRFVQDLTKQHLQIMAEAGKEVVFPALPTSPASLRRPEKGARQDNG